MQDAKVYRHNAAMCRELAKTMKKEDAAFVLEIVAMAEIRTVTTLRYKRAEIEKSVSDYEKPLEQAHSDLAHINAAISIFEASGDPKGFPAYVDIHRLFKRGEPICALQAGSGRRPHDHPPACQSTS
jgi:hypothetical protein